ELLFPEFPGNGPEDTGTPRLVRRVQQNGGVIVKANIGTIPAANFFFGTHYHRFRHRPLLDVAGRNGLLDGNDDLVADCRVTFSRSSEHPDTEHLFGAAVIGYV